MRSAFLKFKPVSGTDNSADSETGPAPSRLATSLTLAAMSLGYGVVQLDVTIVNTALNAIGTSLGGGVAELQWVVSAYTIAFAAFILTAGALGDRIGSKRIFIAGFALFTAASVACAMAPNAATLISARWFPGPATAGAPQRFRSGELIAGGALGRSSPFVIAGFVPSAIFAVLFIWREARAPQPMLPLRLFKNRMFALSSLIGLLVNVAIYG